MYLLIHISRLFTYIYYLCSSISFVYLSFYTLYTISFYLSSYIYIYLTGICVGEKGLVVCLRLIPALSLEVGVREMALSPILLPKQKQR